MHHLTEQTLNHTLPAAVLHDPNHTLDTETHSSTNSSTIGSDSSPVNSGDGELGMITEEIEESIQEKNEGATWKVLIVDDEPWVHDVTLLAMKSICFQGRGIEFIHAFSSADAILKMAEHPDTALLLLDIIMETDTSGLEVVRAVREQQKNKLTRIVLRTGHSGLFPERKIVMEYDIDDYREKTSLVYETFFTLTRVSQFIKFTVELRQ